MAQRGVALVTGSSGGIGRAIAERIARDGRSVAVVARRDPRYPGTVEETVERIEAAGGRAAGFDCDLSDPQERSVLVERVEGELGPVGMLVNNAAVTTMVPLESFPMRRLDVMLEVQVKAPMELSQAVIGSMRAQGGGTIVNISSPAAQHPGAVEGAELSRNTVYGMCKAALERFTTGLAAELYDDDIDVIAVAPRAIVPTFGAAAFFDVSAYPTEPVEVIANAVASLAAGVGERVTGEILYADEVLNRAGLPIPTFGDDDEKEAR